MNGMIKKSTNRRNFCFEFINLIFYLFRIPDVNAKKPEGKKKQKERRLEVFCFSNEIQFQIGMKPNQEKLLMNQQVFQMVGLKLNLL